MEGQDLSDTTILKEEEIKSKGIDDLRDELNTVIDGILSKKTSSETASKSFISNVEDVFNKAEKQLTTKNSDLDHKRKILEDITKTKIEYATDSVKTSLNDLNDAYKFYKNTYYYLIIPLIILILCITGYANYNNIILSIPILSYSVPVIGFPVLKIIFIILSIFALRLLYENFNNFKSDYQTRSNELEDNQNKLDKFSYEIPEDHISSMQIDDIKPFYKDVNDAFEDILVSIGETVPFINTKFEDMTVLIKYQKMVEDFKIALEYYRLLKDEDFFKLIGNKAPAEARIISDDNYWEHIIIKIIITRLIKDKKIVTPRIIKLIYYEHNGQDTTNVYRTILESDKELEALANILLDSELLTSPPMGIKYKSNDIVTVLKNIIEFKISNINQTLIDYGIIVEKFRSTLDYYNLLNYEEFSKHVVLSKMKDIGNNNDSERQVINLIINELLNKDIPATINSIDILYQEHNGLNTLKSMRNIKSASDDLNALSIILIKSKKLISPPIGYTYNSNDIHAILIKSDNFNLSNINKILIRCTKKFDYINSYISFIKENDIDTAFKPTLEHIIDEDNEDENIEQQTIKLSYQVAVTVFNNILKSDEWVESFAKASLTLKYHIDHSFKKYACKISSDDKTTAILRAYYTKSREVGRTSPVTIIELISDMTLIYKEYENRNDNEFIRLKNMLNNGKWYDSSGAFLKEYLDIKVNELNEQLDDMKESIIFKEVITEQFINVDITTVEKAIDAQFFGAYIIIFSAIGDQLAPYVNMLSIRDLNDASNNGENRWRIKTPPERERIKNQYGFYPIYDFMFYSKNTRIGFLNKNEDFVEFKNNFIKDLKQILSIVYKNNNYSVKMGLAIQKITPVESNLGQLDNEGLEDMISIRNLDFAYYISRLALDHLSLQEKAGLLVLEKKIDLLDVINYKNIYQFIKSKDITTAERVALESKELMENVLRYLNTEYGIDSLKRLALDLEGNTDIKDDITLDIERIFYDYISSCDGTKRITEKRIKLLVQRFLNTLEKFAVVYKLQKEV